jgi:hypothetical protein
MSVEDEQAPEQEEDRLEKLHAALPDESGAAGEGSDEDKR